MFFIWLKPICVSLFVFAQPCNTHCSSVRQMALAHMNLGAMLHYNGRLLEAESCYLTALRLQPNDDVTIANLNKLRNKLRAGNVDRV